ncbi:MAG: HAMP domain-containing histidine kinase [Solobacterium sp.]|nr:HAMP domain-containing histidine kinase [Solobacterium sp.]
MKLDKNGIRFRFWLVFFLLALGITVLIGVLQTGLIRPYYRNSKINAVSTVADIIQEDLLTKNTAQSVSDALQQAVNNDVCIVIYNDAGTSIYQADSLGAGCIFSVAALKDEVSSESLKNRLASENGECSFNLTNPNTDLEMIIYGRAIRQPLSNYYLFVNSPLEPIDSVVVSFTRHYLIYMLVAIAAASLVALYISQKVTDPIVRMKSAAGKLAGGSYDIEFSGGSFTETRELANTLNYAKDQLSRVDELRRDLIANVSHDIRTPITDIRAYAEMIQDISGDNPEKREKHLNVIIRETEYMNRLVNDMSELSMMQSGYYIPVLENVDLAGIIRDVAERDMQIVNDAGINLVLDVPETLTAYTDELKIAQIISNYLSNAIKHTPAGKTVTVRGFYKDDGETVRVEIIDEGEGIPEEELPGIWDRYQKSSKSFSRSLTSTGLGLAIVKAIADSLHAGYGVQSELHKGSVFWFELRNTYEI